MTLRFNGVALDTSPRRFGELRDSTEIVANARVQKQRMAEDGYLLFRRFLDRDVVLDARREVLLKYAIIGEIDAVNHPLLEAIQSTHSFVDEVNLLAFTESVRTGLAYEGVVLNRRLLEFYESFLGGSVRCFDFKWPRFVRPGEGCGIHCDIVYVGRGTRNVWSAWIPLGDVPREEGALLILEESHMRQQLAEYWAKDADRDKIGWLSTDAAALQESLGGRWLTTDFHAGDIVLFSSYLAHGALDNCSPVGRCRLTTDSRYQLASEPLDERWNGDLRNPHGGEQRVFLPGLRRVNDNREFEEEWKRVDKLGRLLRE